MIEEARTSPILLGGYILLAALVFVMPFMTAGSALELSSTRIGAADRFTTVVAYLMLVAAFVRVFWMETATIEITRDSVYCLILGIIIEGAGLALQGAYWYPWYIGKINGYEAWVSFSNTHVWMISPAFIMIWVGIGFTANMAIRAVAGPYHVYWPIAWSAFLITVWCIGYQLPDLL